MKNKKKRVLVLDDEAIVCERLQPALERVGFIVETFTDSQAAVDRVAQQRFDIVITDLKMQKPDGLDILRFVREQSLDTKVIVITGFATVETAREALKSGAVDFLAKPFKISQLRDLVLRISGSEGEPADG
jgi:DNA-binding NtrC family response regulator